MNPKVGSKMSAELSNEQPQSIVTKHTNTHTQIYNPSTQVLSLVLPD